MGAPPLKINIKCLEVDLHSYLLALRLEPQDRGLETRHIAVSGELKVRQ